MRRISVHPLLAALAAFALLIAGAAQAQITDVVEDGVLTVAMSGEYPPFSMPDEDGNIVGFDADVAAELAERLGLELEVVKAPFSSIIAGVQTGRYDVSVASHARTPERAAAVQYLDTPYYYSGAQLFAPTDSEYSSLEEIAEAGERVAVDRGGTNQQWLIDNGYEDVVATYSGVQESLLAVQRGQAAAIFTSPIVGNQAIAERDLDMEPIGGLLFEENAWITIANDQPILKLAIEEALDEMLADGTLMDLSERWVGGDIVTPPSE